jgi:hypothetical protein
VEPIQDVLVDDRQLLNWIVDANGAIAQAKRLAEPAIGDRCDARRAVAAKVDGHAIGLLVIQGR